MERRFQNEKDADMVYMASTLMPLGFNDMRQLKCAVDRAIKICMAAAIPVNAHFKLLYLSDHGQLVCDWKLSRLARQLVLINGDPNNPIIAKMQIRLLES